MSSIMRRRNGLIECFVVVMGGLVLQLNLNTGQTHPVNYLLQRCPLYREQRERFRSLAKPRHR